MTHRSEEALSFLNGGPKYPLGTVVQSQNPVTSKLEIRVREKLVAEGLAVHKGRSAIQCGIEPGRGNYPVLTPDILISKTKVCIEVDSRYTHAEEEVTDRVRNALFAGVDWTVVRLRLGGLDPIGEYDVVVESGTATNEAIAALVDAVKDAVAGRPGTLRYVKKKPTTPRKKSRMGAITEDKFRENAWQTSWTLSSGKVVRLMLVDGGRYLGHTDGWAFPKFVRRLDLQDTPRNEWRKLLEPIFEGMNASDFKPVSTFPWGDSLFVGDQANSVVLFDKFNLGGSTWALTANLVGVHSYTDSAIRNEAEVSLVELHPEAVEMGWRIADVELRSGYRGEYQAIGLERIRGVSSELGTADAEDH